VANFSVCTEKFYTDKEANRIAEVMWHHVCIWDGGGRNLGGLSRGVLVHLTGQLRNQKYFDTMGNERFFTEVLADSLVIINDKAIFQFYFYCLAESDDPASKVGIHQDNALTGL
jgi:single-strand DNA-binding protein